MRPDVSLSRSLFFSLSLSPSPSLSVGSSLSLHCAVQLVRVSGPNAREAIRWEEAITHIAVKRHPRRVLLLIKCPRDRHRGRLQHQIVKPASFLLDVICLLHRIFLDLFSRLVKPEIYRHLRANFPHPLPPPLTLSRPSPTPLLCWYVLLRLLIP